MDNLQCQWFSSSTMKSAYKFFITYCLAALGSVALASGTQLAPQDFKLGDKSGDAVFVHFISAEYNIVFDIPNQKTHVTSNIKFEIQKSGMPLFDLVDEPNKILLDGKIAEQQLIDTPHPGDSKDFTQMRVIKTTVNPGLHNMTIEHEIKAFAPTYLDDGVQGGFFMDDFEQRGLLERYLPANLEFDQVKMKFNISVVGGTHKQLIFTNGQVEKVSDHQWSIQFPDYFNCSAVFFDIRMEDSTTILKYSHTSPDGKNIPVTIYQESSAIDDVYAFQKETDKYLKIYENLYGTFPFPSITILHNTFLIGLNMEFAGAMLTDLSALGHELAHSYFGRGVMPANGNAGWIDEAMATYADEPGGANPTGITSLNMADHSPYFRANDTYGYYSGMNFLAYLGDLFHEKDSALSLNDFLKSWTRSYNKQVITTPMLQRALEKYSGLDLNNLFQTYVYGVELISQLDSLR